jgi:hypothetical protein
MKEMSNHKMIETEDIESLIRMTDELVMNYQGNIDDLERAIGILFAGYYFGWRFLRIAHSKTTIRKFESLLNINIRRFFPALGFQSYRSSGLTQAFNHSNFWKVVQGDIKITNRKHINAAR